MLLTLSNLYVIFLTRVVEPTLYVRLVQLDNETLSHNFMVGKSENPIK